MPYKLPIGAFTLICLYLCHMWTWFLCVLPLQRHPYEPFGPKMLLPPLGSPLQTSCPCATQGFHGAGCRILLWCQVLGLSVSELTTAVPSASLKGPLTPLSSLPFNLWFSTFDLGSRKNTRDQCLGLMPGDSVVISVKEVQASGVLKAVSGESISSLVCWMVPSIQGNWSQVNQLPAPEALLGGTGDVWGIW